jgi:hypothetical protein
VGRRSFRSLRLHGGQQFLRPDGHTAGGHRAAPLPTNTIEHPELVAERITRYTDRLGSGNIIAGADCGFGSRIHPELGWAKLAALAEGAALASSRINRS